MSETTVGKITEVEDFQRDLEKYRVYDQPCPSCGRCPTCGRNGYYPAHPWYIPMWV